MQENALNNIPPGYKFYPDDVELIEFYLKPKIAGHIINPGRIHHVDIYMHSPQELNDTYKYKGEEHTYYFTPRSKKYPNGKRPNRATGDFGFWKATGKENPIISNNTVIGNRRTLVFYQKKPTDAVKEAVKTNWIMQEFTINKDKNLASSSTTPPCKLLNNVSFIVHLPVLYDSQMLLDDWVLCKIYQTKHEKERQTNVVATPECQPDQLFQAQQMQTRMSTNVVATRQFEPNQAAPAIQPHLSTDLVPTLECHANQNSQAHYMQNSFSSSFTCPGSSMPQNSFIPPHSSLPLQSLDDSLELVETHVVATPQCQPNQPSKSQFIENPQNSFIPSYCSLPPPMRSGDFYGSCEQKDFNDVDTYVAATNVVVTPPFQGNFYSQVQNMQMSFSPSSPSLGSCIFQNSVIPPDSQFPVQTSDNEYYNAYECISFDDTDAHF
ncbi:protein CUP-SHAPED COTYLEDON 1-like [Gastrolobium bilobum]|uniref:protein CUP-SHAPED COTYLEDON 1-like n=1 Tax=Gastrolobium bilobum TaxID=150636 RepID=UPI002AAF33EE|nr:protein CUP-SHAPED COTYLEDON 1-like [Gastrolobium bilobum]